MKVVGLITEYNPFHNGHQYHIETAKKITGADFAVVVMSGNFVQRGTPAILPKHLRTETALAAGASLVIELPVCYATGSAEYFALGAVSLLEQLGCVDYLCFGSECGDISILKKAADILHNEPEEYRNLLQMHLKSGDSFPRARQKALCHYLNDTSLNAVLEHPNNILGIEYLKALSKLGSKIQPVTIQRIGSDYHDTELGKVYSSASAIRQAIISFDEQTLSDLEQQVPDTCLTHLSQTYGTRYPVQTDDFSLLLKYKLLKETKESLAEYMDISQDLANRIINQRNALIGFEQFCELLKTKEMTYTRISRAFIHILLDMKKCDLEMCITCGLHAYIRVLGFRKDASSLLTLIKANASIPLLTKPAGSTIQSAFGQRMLQLDIDAANLYESVITNKFKTTFINEYEQSIVRI